MNTGSSSSAPDIPEQREQFNIDYQSWMNSFNNQSKGNTIQDNKVTIQGQNVEKKQRKSLSEILPKIQQKLDNKGVCVFSADDNLSEQIDMQFEEEEMWSLPQFLDDQDMQDEEVYLDSRVVQRSDSINSNSTCHSDFGNQNSTNMIDRFAGNLSYLQDIDPSLRLKRCNAIYPVRKTEEFPNISFEQARQMNSEDLHQAFFGQRNAVRVGTL